MSQPIFRRIVSPIGLLQIAIILLTVVTAVIHLQHALPTGGGVGPAGAPPMGAFGPHPRGGGAGPAGAPPMRALGPHPRSGSGVPSAGSSGTSPMGGPSLMANLPVSLTTLFILNFIGYLVLVVALYIRPLQRFQHIIRWLLIAFTAVTIAAWFAIAGSSPTTLGVVDKVIEAGLILLLLLEEWLSLKRRREPHAPPAGQSALQFPLSDPEQTLYQ